MMSPPALLDVNLLIALTWREHVLHRAAQDWFAAWEGSWATTTVTECGFIRVSMNPRVSSSPVSWAAALDMLAAIRATPGHQWWAEEIDISASAVVRRAPVVGHRQVGDVHLAALAAHHGGRLATLDHGIAEALHPEDRDLVTLVPIAAKYAEQ